jgi:hypothetical protein
MHRCCTVIALLGAGQSLTVWVTRPGTADVAGPVQGATAYLYQMPYAVSTQGTNMSQPCASKQLSYSMWPGNTASGRYSLQLAGIGSACCNQCITLIQIAHTALLRHHVDQVMIDSDLPDPCCDTHPLLRHVQKDPTLVGSCVTGADGVCSISPDADDFYNDIVGVVIGPQGEVAYTPSTGENLGRLRWHQKDRYSSAVGQ